MSLLFKGLTRCTLLCIGLVMLASPVSGQESQTLNPRVAQALSDAYEFYTEEEYAKALEGLNEMMSRFKDMKPFDRATVLQVRGSTNINLENTDAALRDFSEALSLNALNPETQNQLRFNVAQLNFVSENYEEAIRYFNEWMASEGTSPTHTAYFMLAAAYYNTDQTSEALEPIDQAIKTAPEPDKRYYDLKNVLLSRLDMPVERIDLLDEMISIWPDNLSYWRQLASTYTEQGDDQKAFATIEAAYLNGLIEDESDIVVLAQYYSTFQNPHRAARLLQKEMDAGNVEENVDNLELLSQLWSQAREHTKAIPVLRQAARLAEDGELYFRLGQSLLASEEYEDAESALTQALDKGGLDSDKRANAWLLLGTARFNQAEPGDREQRMLADEAFAEAARNQSTRRQAQDWRGYIEAINDTEARQEALESEQQAEIAASARERRITGCRARQLAGGELSEECQKLLAEVDEEKERGAPQEEQPEG